MRDGLAYALAALLLALASLVGPAAWACSSRRQARGRGKLAVVFLARTLATPLLVLLPLAAYAVSLSLEPTWPEAEEVGWMGCLTTTSYVWLPAVLWSSASMFAATALGLIRPLWVRSGLLMGCITAAFLTLAALKTARTGRLSTEDALALAFPAATLLAYGLAFAISHRETPLPRKAALVPAITGAALAAANIGAAIARLDRLPYQTPLNCYVVSAATRGHSRVVGPLCDETRGNAVIRVNQQLITLREFEARWRLTSPRSHARARRFYDRVGPLIAARMTNAWVADIAYLSLKPLEWWVALTARPRS